MNRLHAATRTFAVAVFAAGAVFGLASTASATPEKTEPASGDDRATVQEGNVVDKDCDDLFPGSAAIDKADLTVEIDDSNTYIDITAVADGVEVAGVIVKGGPAYNVYAPDGLGDLPWQELHSPLVSSGKPAQISHWFACGVSTAPTSSTPVPTETEEPTTSPTSEAPSSSEAAAPVATTPQEDVENAAAEAPLAETGVDAGWMVALGAALLLGGGALLFLMRMRGARR